MDPLGHRATGPRPPHLERKHSAYLIRSYILEHTVHRSSVFAKIIVPVLVCDTVPYKYLHYSSDAESAALFQVSDLRTNLPSNTGRRSHFPSMLNAIIGGCKGGNMQWVSVYRI